MRPSSIATFERVVLLMLILMAASTAISWDGVEAAARAQRVEGSAVAITLGVLLVLFLALVWLVSRRGSNAARWIYVLIVGAALVYQAIHIGEISGPTTGWLMAAAEAVLALLSIWLLLRPDSNAWFSRGRSPSA